MSPEEMKAYERASTAETIDALAADINVWAEGKGFWAVDGFTPKFTLLVKSQKLMLVVTEIAECVEGLRSRAPSSIEGFSNEEEEIADTIIRLLDYAGQYGLRIGQAINAKMAKNEGRPYRHGKEF